MPPGVADAFKQVLQLYAQVVVDKGAIARRKRAEGEQALYLAGLYEKERDEAAAELAELERTVRR